MSKVHYIPNSDADKNIWLTNFNAKLPAYATALGLLPADTASVAADTAFFSYVLNAQQQIIAYSQQWTSYKNAARDGHAASLGGLPVVPGFGTAPAMVAPGIFNRVAALVARIKVAPGYTDAIGQALGIVGAEDSVDMTQEKPTLNVVVKSGGVNEVGFNKMGAEGVHIYGMRDGETGFTLLASETHSAYVDNRPLLVAGKPETRQYKAVFFLGKSEIGLESDVVPATAAP
jgi:hypothetical protein